MGNKAITRVEQATQIIDSMRSIAGSMDTPKPRIGTLLLGTSDAFGGQRTASVNRRSGEPANIRSRSGTGRGRPEPSGDTAHWSAPDD
jgi:hypothetical protein